MATHTTKANNRHKAHPTRCSTCERHLPKRAFRRECATCIKRAQGKDDFDWQITRPDHTSFFSDEQLVTIQCQLCRREVGEGDTLNIGGKWLCLDCAAWHVEVSA